MKVSPLGGGAPVPLVPEGIVPGRAADAFWGEDGTIVFGKQGGLYRVDAAGGTPALLMEGRTNSPRLLPGGRAVVFSDAAGIHALDWESDSIRLLIPGGVDPQYVDDGPLLYADASGGFWSPGEPTPRTLKQVIWCTDTSCKTDCLPFRSIWIITPSSGIPFRSGTT